MMLHAISQRIADQADMVALAKAESLGVSSDTEQNQPSANTTQFSYEHLEIVQVFQGASSRQWSGCSRPSAFSIADLATEVTLKTRRKRPRIASVPTFNLEFAGALSPFVEFEFGEGTAIRISGRVRFFRRLGDER
jgi:hypothetical protein